MLYSTVYGVRSTERSLTSGRIRIDFSAKCVQSELFSDFWNRNVYNHLPFYTKTELKVLLPARRKPVSTEQAARGQYSRNYFRKLISLSDIHILGGQRVMVSDLVW